MDYTVVFNTGWQSNTSSVLKELAHEVRRLSREGWKPQGGISVVFTSTNINVYQAMIKESQK